MHDAAVCGAAPAGGRAPGEAARRHDVLTLDVPEEAVQARFAALLARNFEEEAEIEREAAAEAERVVRRGAPGVRREELDLRRVEQLVKQRIAERRGFAL